MEFVEKEGVVLFNSVMTCSARKKALSLYYMKLKRMSLESQFEIIF